MVPGRPPTPGQSRTPAPLAAGPAARRRHRIVAVGTLLAVLMGCSPGAVPGPDLAGPAVLPATWREQASLRAADLIYPGPSYPVAAGPIDPEPALYADAARLLAASGELPSAERDHAATLLAQWWPARDDGVRWLSLTRALRELAAVDRVSAERRAPMLTWIRSTLTNPDTGASQPRQVMLAGQLARELLRAAPDDPGVVGLADLLNRAATRAPCPSAASESAAVASAVLAGAADRPCQLPERVRAAVRERLRQPGDPGRLGDRITRVAEVAPLAAVGMADRAEFLREARDVLSLLGQPRNGRGGDAGQGGIVTVVDAIAAVDADYSLPSVQVQNLRRIVRSESRLPDAIEGGDPLDTAIATDTLRRLGQPAPGPVRWDGKLTLLELTALAMALDRDRLPTPAQVRAALDGQPPSTMTLGYLGAAYPGFCPPQTRDLRRTMESTSDLAQWPSDRLFHSALFVAVTASCGGADQQRLADPLVQALDARGRAGGAQGALQSRPGSLGIVDIWYLAEAGCLLGRSTRHLPSAAALREAVGREVGIDRIRPDTTVRHLYAALRLTELVENPGACGSTWWQAGSRR